MALGPRLTGRTLAEPVVNPLTGELMAEAGETLTREQAQEIEHAGVNRVKVTVGDKTVVIFSNCTVDLKYFVNFDPRGPVSATAPGSTCSAACARSARTKRL